MACKGIECKRHKAGKPPKGMGRYESGQSRCQVCAIFMFFNGIYCPCCNTKLRKKPRSMKYKEQLKERGVQKYGIVFDQEVIV